MRSGLLKQCREGKPECMRYGIRTLRCHTVLAPDSAGPLSPYLLQRTESESFHTRRLSVHRSTDFNRYRN